MVAEPPPRVRSGLPALRTSQQLPTKETPLRSNPNSMLLVDGGVPEKVQARLHGFDVRRIFGLTRSSKTLWVETPSSNLWWPYLLTEEQFEILRRTQPNAWCREDSDVLCEIAYLIDGVTVSQAPVVTRQGSLTLFKNVLATHQCESVCAYFRELMRRGWLRKGDMQTPHRWWAHNDALSRFLHMSLTRLVQVGTQCDWQPTFTSFLAYEHPAHLQTHIDREQAALTVSILIGYFESGVAMADAWPLSVQVSPTEDEYVSALVGVGNAAAFRGDVLKHRRDSIPPGHQAWCICLHFAEPTFSGKRF